VSSRQTFEAGFSLVEALVATTIVVVVVAAVTSVLNPARGVFRTQSEVADMQQRLRTGVDALTRDLLSAGAGPYSGALAGSLASGFAPIMPFRRALDPVLNDNPGVFKSNAITIVYVPSTGAQTTVRSDMPTASSPVFIDTESGCPKAHTGDADPACGFKAKATKAAMFDRTGAFDLLGVTSVDEAVGALDFQPQGPLSKAYMGSSSKHLTKIVEISSHVYYLNTSTRQLMHHDGFATATPVLDNIVGLDFEYYGDPLPPTFVRAGKDQTVTYGPAPPAPGVTQAPFAPGENCTWQMSGGVQVTRLALLSNAGAGLVKLTASQLTDGPWCPDDVNVNRYDADLLRIRKVRVTLRVQSGNDVVRGSLATGNDVMFVNRGTAVSRAQTVPDRSARFDVSPRNLNFGR
jgi:type II secretory pathway pseudopilin PulG